MKMVYHYCMVPNCKNTTITARNKTFITLPIDPKQRKLWLRAARRDPKDVSAKSNLHVCEDHFNLEEDMENYMEWKQMGVKKRMKPHVVPHEFACQPDRKRTVKSRTSNALKKRARLELVQDALRNIPSTSKEDLQALDPLMIHAAEFAVVDLKKQIKSEVTDKFASVGVQVKIRPKYRSKLIQCSLTSAMVCQCCSHFKLTSVAVSPLKLDSSNINQRKIYTSSESDSSSESPVAHKSSSSCGSFDIEIKEEIKQEWD